MSVKAAEDAEDDRPDRFVDEYPYGTPGKPSGAAGLVMLDVEKTFEGKGYERVQVMDGTSFRDASTVIVIPSRGIERVDERGRKIRTPLVHLKVVQAWQSMLPLMNQKRAMLYAIGDEVGAAYNNMIASILANPELSKWKYILTLEDDNLVPPDCLQRLLESIDSKYGPFDAVSGIYFTKGEVNMPMAYGDPDEFRRSGIIDFRPRDIRSALSAGNTIMEVNGIAMGCGLWRMDLFRQIPPPWFVTVSDVVEGKGSMAYTQDLYFCQRARQAGKRFAVDFRVRVGHLDVETGTVY